MQNSFRASDTIRLKIGSNRPSQTEKLRAGIYRIASAVDCFIGIATTGAATTIPVFARHPEWFEIAAGEQVSAFVAYQVDDTPSAGAETTHGHLYITAAASK